MLRYSAVVRNPAKARTTEIVSDLEQMGYDFRNGTAAEGIVLRQMEESTERPQFSRLSGLSSPSVSRRHDAALRRMREDGGFQELVQDVADKYEASRR